MSDASSDVSPLEPMITEQHHLRLDSGVSTASSSDYGDGVSVSCLPLLAPSSSPRAYSHILSVFQLTTYSVFRLGWPSRRRLA